MVMFSNDIESRLRSASGVMNLYFYSDGEEVSEFTEACVKDLSNVLVRDAFLTHVVSLQHVGDINKIALNFSNYCSSKNYFLNEDRELACHLFATTAALVYLVVCINELDESSIEYKIVQECVEIALTINDKHGLANLLKRSFNVGLYGASIFWDSVVAVSLFDAAKGAGNE
jgi:hypothetical protein